MSKIRAPWRAVFLTYPCPTCGAKPSEECVTASGNVYADVHVARTEHGNRCPRCGAFIAAEDDPGSLCPKCQLLRQLEIERATYHRRRH